MRHVHATMMSPAPPGTRVSVVQDGYASGGDWDWYHALVDANWTPALESLRRWVIATNRIA